MKTKERFALAFKHDTGLMALLVDYHHENTATDEHEHGQTQEYMEIIEAAYESGDPVPFTLFEDSILIQEVWLRLEEARKASKKGDMMKPTEYVANALKTESLDIKAITGRVSDPETVRLLHAAIGLETEVGEIQDALKKHIFYGKPLDKVNLGEELGDLFWYMAVMSDVLGVSFEAVMEKNIAKLKARYGDKFSSEKALNRDLDTERKILES